MQAKHVKCIVKFSMTLTIIEELNYDDIFFIISKSVKWENVKEGNIAPALGNGDHTRNMVYLNRII